MTKTLPTSDYRAAHERALLLDPPPGRFFFLRGRSPGKMLHGLAAGETPPQLKVLESGIQQGRSPTSLLLTPKGRIVTEFQVSRLGNGDEGELLLRIPETGLEEALSHLSKFLPPRFAKVTGAEAEIGSFLLVGADAPGLLSQELFRSQLSPDELLSVHEGEERSFRDPAPVGVRVVRRGTFAPPTFEVVAEATLLASLREGLGIAGAVESVDSETGKILRLEKGRPLFGVEMDSETLPPEAGVQDRSIDHRKGCYTGQEVIVRIRDRGHVNRHLRGVLLGEASPPEPGTLLFLPEKGEPIGEVRSAAVSPGFGQTIALAYLRREVGPKSEIRVGSPEGFGGEVRDLSDSGWMLVEGDSLLYP